MQVLLDMQRPDGHFEYWYGEGNFNRTALLYALMQSRGVRPARWTPGVAIGAEPELTVNLIPQAHAVVFILAADTGVTKSDLAIWREHLIAEDADADARLVVLNKIDTMWDSLSTPAQVQAQIDRQRATTAEILGLHADQVIASTGTSPVRPVYADQRALTKLTCPPGAAIHAICGIVSISARYEPSGPASAGRRGAASSTSSSNAASISSASPRSGAAEARR